MLKRLKNLLLLIVLLGTLGLAADAGIRARNAQVRIATWEAFLLTQVGTSNGQPVVVGDMLVTLVNEGVAKHRQPPEGD